MRRFYTIDYTSKDPTYPKTTYPSFGGILWTNASLESEILQPMNTPVLLPTKDCGEIPASKIDCNLYSQS